MAVVQLVDSQLRLVFEAGIDEAGNPIYKNKNYNNIDTGATADQLLAAAQAIAGLQSKTLVHVERNDSQHINP